MNIAIIGTGYVGLVTGALFADRGNKVICVEKNKDILSVLTSGKVHIFEPGLEPLVLRAKARGDLSFTDSIQSAIADAHIIFLAVGTPSREDGSFNLSYFQAAAEEVGNALATAKGFKVVVGKSTVPQGTWKMVSDSINAHVKGNKDFSWAYVSNPETLAEGSAIRDFSSPDRVIIGTDSDDAFALMEELYHPFILKRDRVMRGSPADAELTKLFSNTALAARIAMINEFAHIADVTLGADMDVVRKMVCSDSRIGYNFMFPSPGYGGSCFPKDIQGVVAQSSLDGYEPLLLRHVHDSNELHKNYVATRVVSLLKKKNPVVAVWGVTFKPNTDDMRDAASISIITKLLNEGARVIVFDPRAEKAKELFDNNVSFVDTQYDAVKGADALLLLTEWRQFDAPDFKKLKLLMSGNQLFDLRNRWLPAAANKAGFDYVGIGRFFPHKR